MISNKKVDVKIMIINLVGSVIRQAISEYHSKCLKKTNNILWRDAKEFLFDDNRLERFLKKYEMQDAINCQYLRKSIRNKKMCVNFIKRKGNQYKKGV